ncbi:TPM domain-containing protein [Comamonas sp. lk]|uniref:TPM domain-containing protein n=1 Tax=Comamonas sp. lk TaxID=2201272 RepID=UPI000EB5AB6B|nr:TPM domain-containing protein [Comamonas sp. lk]
MPMTRLWHTLAAIVFAWLWLLPSHAQTSQPPGTQLQPVPALTARVLDQTQTLSESEQQSLSQKLKALEDSTGAQVVVLMVPTTAPEDIAAYAWRVASSWKIGRMDIGDGALILVAKNDRRMRIEVARKLEGAIPDLQASRIIDNAMKPKFRANDYAGGLSDAIDQMAMLIRGEKLPAPEPRPSSSSSTPFSDYAEFLLPLLFFGFPIGIAVARAIFGRFLGSLVVGGVAGLAAYFFTTSLLIAGFAAFLGLIFTLLSNLSRGGGGGGPYISSGGGGGSWSSGSGGGGGFSSGGGGSFGGGGASGDW